MKTLMFAGPSLGSARLDEKDGLIMKPPAVQGDLMSAVHDLEPDAVILVDTRTWPNLSVWHKEIIWALSRGVRVVGAGAAGALRAAELGAFGMKGHGEVFRQAAAGLLEDESSVMCRFEDLGGVFHRMTEPLVNIAATLDQPRAIETLGSETRQTVLRVARAVFFEERTRQVLFKALEKEGVLTNDDVSAVRTLFEASYVDIQAEDVAGVLARLGEPGFLSGPAEGGAFPEEAGMQGAIFHNLYHRDRIVHSNGRGLRLFEIGNYVTCHHPDIEELSYHAFNRQLVLVLAQYLEVVPSWQEIEAVVRDFREVNGLSGSQALEMWLSARDLSAEDFAVLMNEEAQVRKLQESFLAGQMFEKNTAPILDLLRLSGDYPDWRARVFEREAVLEQNPQSPAKEFLATDFHRFLVESQRRRPLPWKRKVHPAADRLGISGRELKMELIKDRLQDQVLMERLASDAGSGGTDPEPETA